MDILKLPGQRPSTGAGSLCNFANYAGDNSKHLSVSGINRLHRRVCRLQTNTVGLRIPVFERGLAVICDSNDDVPFMRGAGTSTDDNVTVGDLSFDHRVAFDSKSKLVLSLRKPIFEIEPIG